MGNIFVAILTLRKDMILKILKEIKSNCAEKLQAYKIPMKINLSDKISLSRFKKMNLTK